MGKSGAKQGETSRDSTGQSATRRDSSGQSVTLRGRQGQSGTVRDSQGQSGAVRDSQGQSFDTKKMLSQLRDDKSPTFVYINVGRFFGFLAKRIDLRFYYVNVDPNADGFDVPTFTLRKRR